MQSVCFTKFVVVTDSKTALHWSIMKDPGGTIRRWLDFIQGFNFSVIHRAGKTNVNTDLISRAHQMDEPSPSEKGTLTQETHGRFALPWMNNVTEDYTPWSSTGKICSIVQIQWTLGSSNGMECSDPH